MVSTDFKSAVKKEMKLIIGEAAMVRVIDVIRNNDLKLTACCIVPMGDDPTIQPVTYMESYDKYAPREAAIRIIADLAKTREKAKDVKAINVGNYEEIKNKLFVLLVSRKLNHSMLENICHQVYLDMALVLCILVSSDNEGIQHIKVDKNLFDEWGITEDEAFSYALSNTCKLMPSKVFDFQDVMRGIMKSDGMPPEVIDTLLEMYKDDMTNMYVVTNQQGIFGATTMFYPNLLKEFTRSKHINICTLIPSSIHEFLLIPGIINETEIMNRIEEANHFIVKPFDILGLHPYYYDAKQDKIMVF